MSARKPQALLGFLAGLVTGLAISGGAALYLTLAPLPFINKVQPSTEKVTPVPGDPNKSLYSPHIPSAAPADTPAAAAPGAPAVPASAAPGAQPEAQAAESGKLFLQVGAYKSTSDADAARARLALLGLDGKITEVQSDGASLYRVRLGPYGKLDDLDGIRKTLSENGIEAQLIHHQ